MQTTTTTATNTWILMRLLHLWKTTNRPFCGRRASACSPLAANMQTHSLHPLGRQLPLGCVPADIETEQPVFKSVPFAALSSGNADYFAGLANGRSKLTHNSRRFGDAKMMDQKQVSLIGGPLVAVLYTLAYRLEGAPNERVRKLTSYRGAQEAEVRACSIQMMGER